MFLKRKKLFDKSFLSSNPGCEIYFFSCSVKSHWSGLDKNKEIYFCRTRVNWRWNPTKKSNFIILEVFYPFMFLSFIQVLNYLQIFFHFSKKYFWRTWDLRHCQQQTKLKPNRRRRGESVWLTLSLSRLVQFKHKT